MAVNALLLDKRIQRNALREGLLDRHEFEAYLASLPDLANHVQPLESSGGPGSRRSDAIPGPVSAHATDGRHG